MAAIPLTAPPGVWSQDHLSEVWTSTDQAVVAAAMEATTDFDAAYAVLSSGPDYSDDIPRGFVDGMNEINGVEYPYFFVVPESYQPGNSHEVRVYLHGGVSRPLSAEPRGWWRDATGLAEEGVIAVFPAAWDGHEWWRSGQVASINRILRRLRSEYDVDSDRVYLYGVSDGGSGAFFVAGKAPTAWAGFVSLIGHPSVAGNPRVGAEGEFFPSNLVNRPFYIVNGRRDRLYPARTVTAFIDLFQTLGTDLNYVVKDAGHTVRWWGEEQAAIDSYFAVRPRDPLPDTLSWTTETTAAFNRFAWVRIDSLGVRPSDALAPPDRNLDPFPHRGANGTIHVVREGNLVSATTRGVTSFSLMLSPVEFDLSRPVLVEVNGQRVWNSVVVPSVETLVQGIWRDRDPRMMFGSELQLEVP